MAAPDFVAVGHVTLDRGGETVRPGVVVSQGVWWAKLTRDGVNGNVTTSTALTDLGAGATFFDNLVEVERVSSPVAEQEGRFGVRWLDTALDQ